MTPDDYKHWSAARRMVEQRSLENPSYRLGDSPESLLAMLGVLDAAGKLPPVTIETALQVPAVLGIVNFLSATLASLPLHVFSGTEQAGGDLPMLLNEAPNPEWSSFDWRKYMWQQVFTGGRGLSWIERAGVKPVAIWPMDPREVTIVRRQGRRFYKFDGREYPAADVIDLPFMLKADQLGSYSPVSLGRKAIALAIAMGDFASGFFASGGIPPLSLEGPLPSGADAFRRAQADIKRAIDLAKESGAPFFPMPPGHSLKPVGMEPAKGQLIEARLFQIQELCRLYNLPPVFAGDLSKGTFANTEQQDLMLTKHNIGQRAKQLEDELNLKLFGQRRRSRKVKHNLDGLQRGDFKSRIEGLARAIQTAQMTPDEARALEERPAMAGGDQLYIQGATVPLQSAGAALGQQAGPPLDPEPQTEDSTEEDDADGEQAAE